MLQTIKRPNNTGWWSSESSERQRIGTEKSAFLSTTGVLDDVFFLNGFVGEDTCEFSSTPPSCRDFSTSTLIRPNSQHATLLPCSLTNGYQVNREELACRLKEPRQRNSVCELLTAVRKLEFMNDMTSIGVRIPSLDDVWGYLEKYPGLAEKVEQICKKAKGYFGQHTELLLEVYNDPEIADEYLTMLVRKPMYDNQLIKDIEEFDDSLIPMLTETKGWFLVTTDFIRSKE